MTLGTIGMGKYWNYKLQEKQFLQTGPHTKGLFTGEGTLWAKLKQEEKIHEYPTQRLSREVCGNVEGTLCWSLEVAIQEKRRQRNWH